MLLRAVTVGLFVLGLPCWVAAAESYPAKPVRMIVPWPTGGTADIVTRVVTQKLETIWGQPVVVENKGGASGNIGSELVTRAAPDGYTLMYGAMSTHAMNQWLYSKMTFDPVKDFTPISMLLISTTVLVVPGDSPLRSVADLIAHAKASPGRLNYASVGNGSFSHLAGELLKSRAGIQATHVPYQGGAPAIVDLLAGRTDFLFIAAPPAVPHIRSGKLRLIATADATRSSAFPDAPIVAETIPDFDIGVWSAFFAPPGTPRAIVDKINRDVRQVLQMPEVRQKLQDLGAEIIGSTPEALAARMRQDAEKWGGIIKATGVRID
ncbi:MAG: Bug family tripartite tricarboxylate transporter substrate binding protein [Lautropia sp.]